MNTSRYTVGVLTAALLTIASSRVGATPGHENGILYATDGQPGNLLAVSTTTGGGTIVGPTRLSAIPSLAVSPITTCMVTASGGGNPSLYAIDPSTGATVLIGNTGLGLAAIGDMDFRLDGTLFASVNIAGDGGTGSDHLATIDTSTGRATVIGPFGTCTGVTIPSNGQGECDNEGMEAIAFDAAGTLWGVHSGGRSGNLPPGQRGHHGVNGLYTIDTATGHATFVAPILDAGGQALSNGVEGLHFAADGQLFGGTGRANPPATDGGFLVTINPATGRFSFVGSSPATSQGSSLAGLAFYDQVNICGVVGGGGLFVTAPPSLDVVPGPTPGSLAWFPNPFQVLASFTSSATGAILDLDLELDLSGAPTLTLLTPNPQHFAGVRPRQTVTATWNVQASEPADEHYTVRALASPAGTVLAERDVETVIPELLVPPVENPLNPGPIPLEADGRFCADTSVPCATPFPAPGNLGGFPIPDSFEWNGATPLAFIPGATGATPGLLTDHGARSFVYAAVDREPGGGGEINFYLAYDFLESALLPFVPGQVVSVEFDVGAGRFAGRMVVSLHCAEGVVLVSGFDDGVPFVNRAADDLGIEGGCGGGTSPNPTGDPFFDMFTDAGGITQGFNVPHPIIELEVPLTRNLGGAPNPGGGVYDPSPAFWSASAPEPAGGDPVLSNNMVAIDVTDGSTVVTPLAPAPTVTTTTTTFTTSTTGTGPTSTSTTTSSSTITTLVSGSSSTTSTSAPASTSTTTTTSSTTSTAPSGGIVGHMDAGGTSLTGVDSKYDIKLGCDPAVHSQHFETTFTYRDRKVKFTADQFASATCELVPGITAEEPGAGFNTISGTAGGRLDKFPGRYTAVYTFQDGGKSADAAYYRIEIAGTGQVIFATSATGALLPVDKGKNEAKPGAE